MESGWYITNKGWNLMLKLVSGDATFVISKIMVGSGKIDDSADPAELTEMIAAKETAVSNNPIVDEDGNTISLTIEYRNDMNGGLSTGFYINEIGIYAEDPDEGEILMYYATLGDTPQYIDAYSSGIIQTRRFYITMAFQTLPSSVSLGYTAGAYMTVDDATQVLDDAISKTVSLGGFSFAVAVEDWTDTGTENYPYTALIANESVSEVMIPDVTISETSAYIAADCGLSSIAETVEGGLRLYAQTAPLSEIVGVCRLWQMGENTLNSGATYETSENEYGGTTVIIM